MYLSLADSDKVRKIIAIMKTKKASGGFTIIVEILKEIADSLSHLINKTFETGTHPKTVKAGLVKPLYMSRNMLLAENQYSSHQRCRKFLKSL